MPSFADRLRDWRSGLVARPGFQALAARLPFINRIAAGRTRALFDLTSGFIYSQVLFSCVELDLFSKLKADPATTAEIAAMCRLNRRAANLLTTAAAELKLIRKARDGRWRLDDFGAVVAGNPGIASMIRHHAMLYRDLADPLTLLRGNAGRTETADFWAYAGGRAGEVSDAGAGVYSDLMGLSQDLVAQEVLSAYPAGRHNVVLDVGGGDGTFLRTLGEKSRKPELWLFDLPAVAPLAETRFAEAGLADRASIHSGDFFSDPLPFGADLVTLIRIVCDHDDDAVVTLLRNLHRSMHRDANLLIAEPMAGPEGGAGPAAAYFSFYFLAMKSGRCRSPAELTELLEKAGFSGVEWRKTRRPIFASVIVAHP